MKAVSNITHILQDIHYPGFVFHVGDDVGTPYLQVRCDGVCNVTGEPLQWSGRKWRLSNYMTRSEVVQTAFKAVLTAVEHEVREAFKYRGRAIFDPHYNVDELWRLRGSPDAREERP